jgi:hypothetical protein
MNNLPIDLRSPDYTGRQSLQDLIPYTIGDIAKWAQVQNRS